MIRACPRCHAKNRLPETPRADGRYQCSRCRAPLPAHGGAWRFPPLPAWLAVPAILYAATLLTLTVSNALGPERWWPGSLNLYLPQWLWAIPAALLLPLSLWRARRWAWAPLLALAWVLGPLMGFCWHPAYAAPAGRGLRLRVMTYNVKWGSRNDHAIASEVRAAQPDVFQMQDSAGVLGGELGSALAGWNVRVSGQYIVASRLPLSAPEARDISFAGTDHHCVRCTLQIGDTPVTLYDAHLLSPRWGLVAIRHRQVGGLDGNTGARLQEASELASWLRQEQGPTILTGDLNAPLQSLVCRRLCAVGLRDAFAEAGRGYGYTYGGYTRLRAPYVRIDHILVSRQWQVENCWAGNAAGSDHCPVIADLALSALP